MRSQGIGAALLVVAALVLAGCSPTTEPPQTEPTSVVSSPTPDASPTPTETPDPVEQQASVAFDGDCSAAISDENVADLLGPEGHLAGSDDTSAQAHLVDAAALAAGTLSCSWQTAVGGDFIHAVMSPVDTIAPEIVDDAQPASCGDDGWGGQECSVSVAVGDAWLTLVAPTEDILTRAMASIGAELVTQTPSAAVTPEDAWAIPTCAALVPAVQAAIPGGTAVEGFPSDNNPGGPFYDRLHEFGSLTYCGFMGFGPDQQIARSYIFTGIDVTDLMITLAPITVAGADAAYGADTGEQVAIVGSNAVVVDDATNIASARTLLAALIAEQTTRPEPTPEDTDE